MAQPAFKDVLNTVVFLWLSEIVHHREMTHVSWLVRVLLAPVLAGGSILGWPFSFTTDNSFSLGVFSPELCGVLRTRTDTTILFPPIFFTFGLWEFQNTSREFNEPIRAHNKYM